MAGHLTRTSARTQGPGFVFYFIATIVVVLCLQGIAYLLMMDATVGPMTFFGAREAPDAALVQDVKAVLLKSRATAKLWAENPDTYYVRARHWSRMLERVGIPFKEVTDTELAESLKNANLLAVISLPDHAFRKSGAQNKTSLLFFKKFTEQEHAKFNSSFEAKKRQIKESHKDWNEIQVEEEALKAVYREWDYRFFIAEAEQIGYNPAGNEIEQNDLYALRRGLPDRNNEKTILGQYFAFLRQPARYQPIRQPPCVVLTVSEVFQAHPTYRLDPKFHLFKHERLSAPPHGMKPWRIGDLLRRREERIEPTEYPEKEFKVLTLTQEGQLEDREPGKGESPPAWYGQYFSDGSRWLRRANIS